MSRKRGPARYPDDGVEPDVRTARRARAGSPDLDDARDLWEPIVCPACGAEHPDTVSVRLRRTGGSIEARCADCGAVAARFTGGLWSS
ncbi:MAG: hypothetical protein QJR03_02995 [Sphaerobacter sp.]|nr:hypothetical protein [Sphaerobacter sp.]